MNLNFIGDQFDPMHSKRTEFFKEMAKTQTIFSFKFDDAEPCAFHAWQASDPSTYIESRNCDNANPSLLFFQTRNGFIGVDTWPHKTLYRLLANAKSLSEGLQVMCGMLLCARRIGIFGTAFGCRRNSYRYAN
jgi:hypothetical protein